MPLALWALTLSAFAIGTTEFVIVGLVPTIAADLGVSLPSAGLLVSLYAVGVAIGAPILTALTGRWNRKIVLMSLMGLFVMGNLLAWQAPSYETLILARILTGLAHGVFFSIGSMIATSLVSKEKEASAIASHCKTTTTVSLFNDNPWLWWYVYGIYLSSPYLRAADQICAISHWSYHARIWRVCCYRQYLGRKTCR
ncbi:MFS transporter [Psychrobacter sp. AOP7-A1-24]|uniref:MFS transporter n=1 Tax=Psychrobacter sp. AOP7-A1-24 TaxID=3457646 RepID=UPI00402B685B